MEKVGNDNVIDLVAIDDDRASLEIISAALADEGLVIHALTDPEQGLKLAVHKRAPIVVVDFKMPNMGGMQILERILEISPTTEVIFVTGHYSPESAVEAIHKGASDYLTKPLNFEQLQSRVRQIVADIHRRRRAVQLDLEVVRNSNFEGMVGRSPLMAEAFAKISRVAPHYRTALIRGETGTGKELAARALHNLSPVSSKPFVACNCAAVVETLFESELFGHVKGAFTGAVQEKMGLFEHAQGGTVFLDEIGEMPLATQAKILRVLQEREVQRVGSHQPRKVSVRVIAATNRDLRLAVTNKTFRDDLYYRLCMVEITLPNLSDRKDDLPLLENFMIEQFSREYQKPIRGLTRRAQAVLARYSWPGNVRELENVLGHACMIAEGNMIDIRDLPEVVRLEPQGPLGDDVGGDTLEEVQRRHIHRILRQVSGNKQKAAQILNIGRTTLYRMLQGEEQAGHRELMEEVCEQPEHVVPR